MNNQTTNQPKNSAVFSLSTPPQSSNIDINKNDLRIQHYTIYTTMNPTDFYEIDCDELTFPNLTTINDIPNEILEMISLHKSKMEIDDSYDDDVNNHELEAVERVQKYLDTLEMYVDKYNFTLRKSSEKKFLKINKLLEAFAMYYERNSYDSGQQGLWEFESWDKKEKHFDTLRNQRKAILNCMRKDFKEYEIINYFCEDYGNNYLLSGNLNDGFQNYSAYNVIQGTQDKREYMTRDGDSFLKRIENIVNPRNKIFSRKYYKQLRDYTANVAKEFRWVSCEVDEYGLPCQVEFLVKQRDFMY